MSRGRWSASWWTRGETRGAACPRELMAGARETGIASAGKSDPIDALAVARAALREGIETLPVAAAGGRRTRDPASCGEHRERLVDAAHGVDQRAALASARPVARAGRSPPRALIGGRWQSSVAGRLARSRADRAGADRARRATPHARAEPHRSTRWHRELAGLVAEPAPRLLAEPGCGVLTAAKLVGEIAGIGRFASDAKLARLAGSAPIPASSGQQRPPPPRSRRQPPAQLRDALLALSARSACDPAHRRLHRSQASQRARPTAKRCAASNAISPAASTTSCAAPASAPTTLCLT